MPLLTFEQKEWQNILKFDKIIERSIVSDSSVLFHDNEKKVIPVSYELSLKNSSLTVKQNKTINFKLKKKWLENFC